MSGENKLYHCARLLFRICAILWFSVEGHSVLCAAAVLLYYIHKYNNITRILCKGIYRYKICNKGTRRLFRKLARMMCSNIHAADDDHALGFEYCNFGRDLLQIHWHDDIIILLYIIVINTKAKYIYNVYVCYIGRAGILMHFALFPKSYCAMLVRYIVTKISLMYFWVKIRKCVLHFQFLGYVLNCLGCFRDFGAWL